MPTIKRSTSNESVEMSRSQPNIIVTGTPGVGKTSHSEVLAASSGLKHLSINQIVKERNCHGGWDASYQSWIVDEDKVGLAVYLIRTYRNLIMPQQVAGLSRGRSALWRLYNRLACLRSVSQKLDRFSGGAEN